MEFTDEQIEQYRVIVDHWVVLDEKEEHENAFVNRQRDKHPRASQPWSIEEISLLKELIALEMPVQLIADILQRSAGAIYSRRKRIHGTSLERRNI